MDRATPPDIDCEQHHTGLWVSDVPTAIAFYTGKLGFKLAFTWGDPPTMAGVTLGRCQLFLERGTPNPAGCTLDFVVDDADELFDFHRAGGVEIVSPPADKPYRIRDYSVRDLHGYRLEFGHRLQETHPPLEIERVDVPVRLEKRLAALLSDLAAHKRMSLAGCLEEILLHTCEPLGDGVASPHTPRTLRYIGELKKKHAIDYDCHASYRFVERPADGVNPPGAGP
jgi:catechol 2,3-dioxygenase-like lactoylglutathione lyase family enzyme